MPAYLDVTLRAVLTYLVLLSLARLMGKREISQMTFFDYIVGITIGSISAQMSTNLASTWLHMLPAAVVFASFQIISTVLSLKSIKFRKLISDSPTVIIKGGKLLEKNIAKEKLSVSEVMTKLREKNAFKLADVETAIFETDGQISVQLKSHKAPATPSDLNISVQSNGLPRIVIEDGKVMEEGLKDLKLTRAWLYSMLAKQNVCDPSKVMLAQVDTSGSLYVDLYEDGINNYNTLEK